MRRKDIAGNSLAGIIFLATMLALTAPVIMLTFGASDTFSVAANIQNVAPTVPWVNTTSSAPSSGTTKIAQVNFTATDTNGYSDLNMSSAYVNISKNGITRQSTNCSTQSAAGNSATYICNLTIYWYDEPGSWNVTAYIRDNAGSAATNLTTIFTISTVDYIDVIQASLGFSGNPGDNDVAANSTVVVNNTGNTNYTIINLTGFDLQNGSYTIGIGNFSVNISNSAYGQAIKNNLPINITGAYLNRNGSQSLYFYLDIPAGVANLNYAATSSWSITPIP